MFDTPEQFEEFSKEAVEIADAVLKMTETKGWEHIEELLKVHKDSFSQPADVYYRNEDLAGYHAGGMYTIGRIEDFIKTNLNIINDPKYAKENK